MISRSTIRVFLRAKEGRGHAVDRIVNIIVFESHGRRNINIGMFLFRFSCDEIRRVERAVGARARHTSYTGHGYSCVIHVWSGRTRSPDTGQKRGE